MKASVKCSNCGAEIDNLNFSSPKGSWALMVLPLILIVVSLGSLWGLYRPKGDYRADLVVTVLEKRVVHEGMMEILGTIENRGKQRWEHIELDAEFYAADGRFLDAASGRVASSVDPGKTEHFKIMVLQVSSQVDAEGVRMDVKVADAFSSRF